MGVSASCGDQTITLYLLSKGADPEVKPRPLLCASSLYSMNFPYSHAPVVQLGAKGKSCMNTFHAFDIVSTMPTFEFSTRPHKQLMMHASLESVAHACMLTHYCVSPQISPKTAFASMPPCLHSKTEEGL